MGALVYLIKLLFIHVLISCAYGDTKLDKYNNAIDLDIYENILDAEECDRQVRFIRGDSFLQIQFADAGARTPRGILTGNSADLGNYHQCLGITHQLPDMDIQGKYCSILVPFNQTLQLPQLQEMQAFAEFNHDIFNLDKETINRIEEYQLFRASLLASSGEFDLLDSSRTMPGSILSANVFRLGICVPKPCTTQQAMTSLLFNLTAIGFEYTEDFCRVPNDKPWVAADTCAVVIFSIIGVLTILSTLYDVYNRFIIKIDLKTINPLYQSFSVYTNGQRLMNFGPGSGNLQCIDGIRTLAMMWVIVGHSFVTELFIANPTDSFVWQLSAEALWITAATVTVDTFFTLSGVLLVYSTAGKMSEKKFIKNLHWFYLNRVVRIYPLLATAVLLQASYFNRMSDGPFWWTVINQTNRCRNLWWSTLFNVQNYLYARDMCITHSWFVAIDMQLYTVSPLVLYWVFTGKRKTAWIGLFTALFAVLTASTIYNFTQNFQAGVLVPSRFTEQLDYMAMYYRNSLTRGATFFVGMIFGYLLHICRGRKVKLPRLLVAVLWLCSAACVGAIFYFKYRIKQFDWDNQLVDNLMNSFMRPVWGAALCWLIFACVHGYSGPINWFLSLDIWRLPARLTYGMYLFHYPLMFVINGSTVAPVYFSVAKFTFKYLSHQVLAVVVSFVLTLLIEAPISFLYKRLMDIVQKKVKPVAVAENNGIEKGDQPKNGMEFVEVPNDQHKTQ